MSNSTRQNILTTLKTLMESIVDSGSGDTIIKQVENQRVLPINPSECAFPAVFNWLDNCSQVLTSQGGALVGTIETWNGNIIMCLVTDANQDIETILKTLQAFFNDSANAKLSGYLCENMRLLNIGGPWPMDLDPDFPMQQMNLTWKVVYRHDRVSP